MAAKLSEPRPLHQYDNRTARGCPLVRHATTATNRIPAECRPRWR